VKITDYFRSLGAPLANQRWSWGAVRESDGVVFLRVWQDQILSIDGVRTALVADHHWHAKNPQHPGYQEGMRQLEAIRGGAPSYLIMCVAKNAAAELRDIDKYNRDHLFVGARLRTYEGQDRLEIVDKVDSHSMRPHISLERTRAR
jgi:hypothetical protein